MPPLARFIVSFWICFLGASPGDLSASWWGNCGDREGPMSYSRCHQFRHSGFYSEEVSYELNKKNLEETENRFGFSREELKYKLRRDCEEFQRRYGNQIKIQLDDNLSYHMSYPRSLGIVVDQFRDYYGLRIKTYFRECFFVLVGTVVRPNYPAVQLWQSGYVKPVYEKLESLGHDRHMSEREFTELIAHFVQGLKYKIPPKPKGKENLGLWPPLVCLKEKAGDCDSKSTLFATLYYHFRKKATVLFMTQRHAFIGLKNQHKIFPADKVVTIGGADYAILESTAYLPIGQMRSEDIFNLRSGRFTYMSFY
jgi:hypothetical protein